MSKKLSLSQDQRISQRLSQSQVRFVRMLEMNAQEAENAVNAELEANPALAAAGSDGDSVEPDAGFTETPEQLQEADYAHPDDIPFAPRSLSSPYTSRKEMFASADTSSSLADVLTAQLHQISLDSLTKAVAEYIIGTLDDNGYSTRSLQGIADDLLFKEDLDVSPETVSRAFDIVRSLDPAGVGAESLQDCLLLQLTRMPESETSRDALEIITSHFERLALKHYHKIQTAARLSRERLDKALHLILSLNPKPGSAFSSSETNPEIVPDFSVDIVDGDLRIHLDNRIPELAVDASFDKARLDLEKNASLRQKQDAQYIVSRCNDAREFIRILKRRQQTLFDVITAIVSFQKDYFLTEDESNLRPMALKDISAISGLDIPTISRATNNKYIAAPWGIIPLRHLFSESFAMDSGKEKVSGRKIETILRQLVDDEDPRHPLSDDQLARRLVQLGYDVSRRTVSKYRDRLKIPVARLRKSF